MINGNEYIGRIIKWLHQLKENVPKTLHERGEFPYLTNGVFENDLNDAIEILEDIMKQCDCTKHPEEKHDEQ